ncbi:unnamed protein product, partial [marine sediment metagenome]
QGPQRQASLEMFGKVEGYTNRTFLYIGKVTKSGGGSFSISYERAVRQKALSDAAGD